MNAHNEQQAPQPAAAQEAVAEVVRPHVPESMTHGEAASLRPRVQMLRAMPPVGTKLYAADPVAAAPAEMSPEFTDTARAAIAWVLLHHQGGSSPVGQPLRFALGMGAHEPLPDWRIAEAKRYAEWAGATTANLHEARASTHAAPADTWFADQLTAMGEVIPLDSTPAAPEAVGWFTDDYLTDKSATTYDPLVAERWRNKGWPVTALYAAPVTAAPEASYFEYLDRYNHSLRRAIHAMMAKLVFLLDEDQFADIEAIALAAGVTPAAPGIDQAIAAVESIQQYMRDDFQALPPEVFTLPQKAQRALVTLRGLADAPMRVHPRDAKEAVDYVVAHMLADSPKNGSEAQRLAVADAAALRRALTEYPGRKTHQLQARRVCAGVLSLAESYGAVVQDSPKGGSEARDAALNTLAIMFHNSEEIEGPDGMAVSIDLALWHEALEAYEVLIGDYDEVTLATSAQAQAGDAEVQP